VEPTLTLFSYELTEVVYATAPRRAHPIAHIRSNCLEPGYRQVE
jgi:hypothetical protein